MSFEEMLGTYVKESKDGNALTTIMLTFSNGSYHACQFMHGNTVHYAEPQSYDWFHKLRLWTKPEIQLSMSVRNRAWYKM